MITRDKLADTITGPEKTLAVFHRSLHPAAEFSPDDQGERAVRQLDFEALDPVWEPPPRPGRWHLSPYLSDQVRKELREFEQTLLDQGRVKPKSAWSYRNLQTMNAKIAGRLLGRPLSSLRELYAPEVLERVLRYDGPIDGEEGQQQSTSTVKARRTPLRQYPRAIPLPGVSYQDAKRLIDQTLRRLSRRRGDRYNLDLGQPFVRRYVPPREHVLEVISVLLANDRSFLGPRNALALALMYYHGLRSDTVLKINSEHVSWRHDQLFLMITEKHKRGRREIEAHPAVARVLRIYVARFNGYGGGLRVPERIELGAKGTFWYSEALGRINYEALRKAVHDAAIVAGVRPFQLHAVRHLYGSELGNDLPLADAALAGGWRSPTAYLRSYARPLPNPDLEPPRKEEKHDAPLPGRATVAPVRRRNNSDEGEQRSARTEPRSGRTDPWLPIALGGG